MASNKAVATPAKPADAHANPLTTTTANGRPSLIMRMAAKYEIDPDKMLGTLKATAFRGEPDKPVTNEQLMALLIVAQEYNLNPWLKEIYAFPDKSGGIVPVIGVDGWIRMMNEHPQYVSHEFRYPDGYDGVEEVPAWMECAIWRKDRDKPTVIREFFAEVKRNTAPWGTHPRRMLRHKTLIQTIRVAFGFAGVYDPDEAERLREIDVTPRATPKPTTEPPKAISNGQPALANEEQIALIREQLADHEIPISDAVGQFGIEQLEALQFDQVQPMLDWIAKQP